MKKISKIISMCLICVLAIAGAITGLVLMNKKPNNEDSSVIEPVNIYYATAEENTGAALAAEEKKGGAHYVGKGSLLELTSGLTRGQEANYGGAIYIDNGGRFVLNGGTISYNYAEYGGAIYVAAGGVCELNAGTISYNKSKDAAAIYVEAGATLIIGDNVVIQNNGYVEFDEYVVNYYVDGVLTNSVSQGAPVVNIDNVGTDGAGDEIDYTMCNGFFTDSTYIVPLEEGETIPFDSEVSGQSATVSTSERNVYTKKATPEKLSFTELDDGNYSVRGIDGITGAVVIPQQYKAEGEDEARDVVEIEEAAFSGFYNITNLYINTNITIIPVACCADSSIGTINITEHITEIHDVAFEWCGLEELRISKSVEYIGEKVVTGYIGWMRIIVDEENPVYDSRDNCNIIVETATNNAIAIIDYEDFINMPNTIKIIGKSACVDMYGLEDLDKLEIPEGIEEIQDYAFKLNSFDEIRVTSVVLPQSLQELGASVFEEWNLSELTVKSGLTTVDEGALKNYDGSFLPITTLNIDMVTIPGSTFNFPSLETLTIGDNATTISANAFNGCSALNEVVVGKGVKTVNSAAFTGCDAVKDMSVYCNADNTNYSYLPCNSIETLTFDVAKTFPSAFAKLPNLKTIVMGDLVTSVGWRLFMSNAVIEDVTIGYGVKSIDAFAFRECTNLRKVTMPATTEDKIPALTTLKQGAFYKCSALQELLIPGTITDIALQTCYMCPGLQKAVLEEGLGMLPSVMFADCSNLTEVNIPSTVTSIGERAFENCALLETINIPGVVTTINGKAFNGCSKLKTVNFEEGITAISSNMFTNCSSLTEIITRANASDIPTGVEGKVVLPTTLTEVGFSSFSGCSALTKVILPDSVQSASGSAFSGCSSLSTFISGKKLSTFGANVFQGCTSLSYIVCEPETSDLVADDYVGELVLRDSITVIPESMFHSCSGLLGVEIPESSVNIGNSAFYGCSNIPQITLSLNTTTLGSAIFYGCSNLEEVTLRGPITSWAPTSSIFGNCSSLKTLNIGKYMTSMPTIPSLATIETCDMSESSVTDILASTFQNCSSLKNLTLPAGLLTIGAQAFNGCTSLTVLNLPKLLTSIEVSSVRGAKNLAALTIDDSNAVYTNGATNSNVLIKRDTRELVIGANNAVIPSSSSVVTSIGRYAFYYKNIYSINIPANITLIGLSAFQYCEELTNLTFDNPAVTSTNGLELEAHAFRDCSSLGSVSFPDRMKIIRAYSFLGTAITSVDLSDCSNLIMVGKKAFDAYNLTSFSIYASDMVEEDEAFVDEGEYYYDGSLFYQYWVDIYPQVYQWYLSGSSGSESVRNCYYTKTNSDGVTIASPEGDGYTVYFDFYIGDADYGDPEDVYKDPDIIDSIIADHMIDPSIIYAYGIGYDGGLLSLGFLQYIWEVDGPYHLLRAPVE